MRVHLPALIALLSAATYGACGSSDASKSAQSGGEGGEGGDPTSAGGTQNSGGSQSSAGGVAASGQAGELGKGGAPAAGMGPMLAGESSGGASGAAGAAGAGNDPLSLPSICPGPLESYVTVLGTDAADHFMAADVSGQKLIFGLDGADIFDHEHGGSDCLVGGPGDDSFSNSDEFANYYVGGPGADTYHIDTTGNYLRIGDLEAADRLSFSRTAFTFLSGAAGDTINANQIHSVPGYSTGTSSGVVEGASLVYDPTTGELWQDWDGGVKGSSVDDKQILTVLNHDGYTFDIADFVLE